MGFDDDDDDDDGGGLRITGRTDWFAFCRFGSGMDWIGLKWNGTEWG